MNELKEAIDFKKDFYLKQSGHMTKIEFLDLIGKNLAWVILTVSMEQLFVEN